MPLGSIRAPPRGRPGKNIKKNLLLRNHKTQSFIFCVKQCIVVLFINSAINPANCAPGVQTGPAPGASWEKHKKNLLLRNHMTQSFHMLCGPMYNTLLYKCCQRYPWGPYRPRPRHVIIFHRLIMEIYEKIFPATA